MNCRVSTDERNFQVSQVDDTHAQGAIEKALLDGSLSFTDAINSTHFSLSLDPSKRPADINAFYEEFLRELLESKDPAKGLKDFVEYLAIQGVDNDFCRAAADL